MKLRLEDCKLWWPAWQQGIPFTGCNHNNRVNVSGDNYVFNVDRNLDSWLCPDGSLMPIGDAVLEDVDEGPIEWTSLSILKDRTVQINFQPPGELGWRITYYRIEDLFFCGDTYEDFD